MSSQQGAQGPPDSVATGKGPPYAPRDAGLGGSPDILPDVPVAVIFLVFYLVFGVIHIKIFKSNKHRGHKFIFNGAILGLCKIRIITMVLRIAWANYPRDVGLAIAANIFTYIGTIILYMVNWFFAQRIIRAQHPSLGWSTQYRLFHRGGLVLLVFTLLGLIVSQIWKFFTLTHLKQDAFRVLFLVAQTYATVFCFAPAILVALSLLIPRTEVEKFGAGRLRYNITILVISVCILSIGQVFRCVLAWIPPTLMIDVQRGNVAIPWYLSKASFYCFNFLTEILVVMLFAVVRVDLRFYVPNGANKEGDYSKSRLDFHNDDEKTPVEENCTKEPMIHHNDSNQTLHRYQSSVFEDTQTLADSLRYPHSTLEVDEKTGSWKVKRLSTDSGRNPHSAMLASKSALHSGPSKSTLNTTASGSTSNDRNFRSNNSTPPVPELPAEWPLPDAAPPQGTNPVLEHPNMISHKVVTRKQTFELENHELNNVDVGDAVTDALARLEMNSDKKKAKAPVKPPLAHYRTKTPIPAYKSTSAIKSVAESHSNLPKSAKYKAYPPPREPVRHRASSTPLSSPRYSEDDYLPDLPRTHRAARSVSISHQPANLSTSPSLEIISLLNTMSGPQSRIIDASLLREPLTANPTHLERSPILVSQTQPRPQHHHRNHPSSSNIKPNPYTPPNRTIPSNNNKNNNNNSHFLHPDRDDASSTSSSTHDRPYTQTSSNYSHEYSPSSIDTAEKAWAQEEFRRFSSEPLAVSSTAGMARAASQLRRV
ncbi:hypothetical protein J3E71DRAFT_399997 [Bipolaris maydis]|nr:hypothetical protein J3E73DRAFT_235382 [Bipolaris maydis]KAJ6281123.1 hypothetical protein J3E71DRAFT_399997 [Bipolaris maydis]